MTNGYSNGQKQEIMTGNSRNMNEYDVGRSCDA